MKQKKTLAALLAVMLAFSMGSVAFAHNDDGEEKEGRNHGISVSSNVDVDASISGSAEASAGFNGEGHLKNHDDDGDGDDDKHDFRRGHDDGDEDEDNDNEDRDDEDRMISVRGLATVTAVSSSSISAEQSFRHGDRDVTLAIDGDTDFFLRTGAEAGIGDVDEGDLISFRGTITDREDGDITVDASSVRIWGEVDLSARAKISGTVTSVDNDDMQLVIETDDDETVTVNASDLTVVKDDNGDRGVFADIAAGMEVRIKGFWNSMVEAMADTITAVKIRIL